MGDPNTFEKKDKKESDDGVERSHISDVLDSINSESDGESQESTTTDVGGFSIAPSSFDSEEEKSILEHYKNKKGKGVLSEDDRFEDSVEDEIKTKIADFEREANRKVSSEERSAMSERIRSLRHGAWLESLKSTLEGKSEVPIEHFNHLVYQYEATIPLVSHQISEAQKKVDEKDKEIEDLKEKNGALANDLQKQKSTRGAPTAAEGSDDVHSKCRGRISELERQLKAESEALEKAEELSEKNEELKAQNEDLQHRLKHATDQAGHIMKQNEQLEAKLKKSQPSKRGIESAGRKGLQAEIARLTKRISTEQKEHEAKIASLTKQNEELEMKAMEHESSTEPSSSKADQGSSKADQSSSKADQSSDKADDEKLKEERDRLTKINRELRETLGELPGSEEDDKPDEKMVNLETNQLRVRIDELEGELKASKAVLNPGQLSDLDLLQHVEHLQEEIRVMTAARDKFHKAWAARITEADQHEHLRLFWDAVEDTRKTMGSFQERILTLYTALGFTNYVDANVALDRMTKACANTSSSTLRLQIVTAQLEAKKFQLKVHQLRDQIANTPSPRTDAQIRADLGVHDEEEMERRVSSRTQTYRLHRRAYLENIFRAGQELEALAVRIPDDGVKAPVRQICALYLAPTSLPPPPAPVVGRV